MRFSLIDKNLTCRELGKFQSQPVYQYSCHSLFLLPECDVKRSAKHVSQDKIGQLIATKQIDPLSSATYNTVPW